MTKIIQRHDTAANWTSVNPVLAAGEMGVETDTNKFKFGDGTTAWADLAYAVGSVDAYTKAETDNLLNAKQDVLTSVSPLNISLYYPDSVQNIYEKFDTNTYSSIDNPAEFTLNNPADGYARVISISDMWTRKWELYFKLPIALNCGIGFKGNDSHKQYVNGNYAVWITSLSAGVSFKLSGWEANGNQKDITISDSTALLNGYIYLKIVKSSISTGSYDAVGKIYWSVDGVTYADTGLFLRNRLDSSEVLVGFCNPPSTSVVVDLTSVMFQYTPARKPYYKASINHATAASLGVVQPDNTTIVVDENGVISSVGGGGGSGTTLTSTDGTTTYSTLALGDTLAVMDGTLNANLNGLVNEVNTLASTVSTLENYVSTVEDTVSKKQDKLTAIKPIVIKTDGTLLVDLETSGTVVDNGDGSYTNPISTAGKTNWVKITPALDCIYTSDWEMIIPFKWDRNSNEASQTFIGGNSNTFIINIEDNNFRVWYNSAGYAGTNFLPSIGIKTWMKLKYNGGALQISFSTNGETYSNLTSHSRSTLSSHTETYFFGGAQSWQQDIRGGMFTIFFNEVKIYKGGVLQYDGIPAYSDTFQAISANPATTSSLGVVQPDGTSITVSETGVISGQDVKTFTGYSDTGTLVLKSINGVLQWVAEA